MVFMVRTCFALVLLLAATPALAQEPPLPAGAVARVGSTRLRHGENVCALAYTPDGKLLASADIAGGIRVHDAAGKLLRQFSIEDPPLVRSENLTPPAAVVDELDEGLGRAPIQLCFGADGRRLFVGTGKVVRAYRLDTGKLEFSHPLHRDEMLLAISPGLSLAVAGQTYSLREIDATGHAVRPRAIEDLKPTRAVFTPHGLLATGKFAGVRLFDIATGKLRDSWSWSDYNDIPAVELSPDGKMLALLVAKPSKADDPDGPPIKELVLWNARGDGKRLCPPGVTDPECVAYTPDGKYLAVGCREGLLLLDPHTGGVVKALPGAPKLEHLAFSPDGARLAGAGGPAISQWDVANGRRLDASAEPTGAPHGLRFLDARRLRVFAGEIVEYDWRTNAVRKRYSTLPHEDSSEVSPDGTLVAVGDEHGVRLIDVASGRLREFKEIQGRCAFSPDGARLFVFGDDGRCDVIDCPSSARTRLFDSLPVGPQYSLSPDGRVIAGTISAEGEAVVRLWDSRTAAKLGDLRAADDLTGPPVFSPDGRRVAVTSLSVQFQAGEEPVVNRGWGMAVWDVASGRRVRDVRGLADGALNFALSPDGRSAAVGFGDGSVQVIEIATGAVRARFAGHQQAVAAVAFSPDGRHVASASDDAPVFVWDLQSIPPGPTPPSGQLWSSLGRDDLAFVAMQRLIAAPDAAVALFREHIRPVTPVAEDRLRQLIDELDSRRYAVRSRAAKELRRVADQAEARLTRVLATGSAEVRQQARALLERADEITPDFVLRLRALEVLERVNTVAARTLVAEWATGAPGARFTQEAQATLQRMKQ
jgi:WD40 repeat protein